MFVDPGVNKMKTEDSWFSKLDHNFNNTVKKEWKI